MSACSRRRAAVLAVGAAAVLLQCATAADAVLVNPTNAPTGGDTFLVQKDSSSSTYAGGPGQTRDDSKAPVSVEVTFP